MMDAIVQGSKSRAPTYQANSGLPGYDSAIFHGAPPVHSPLVQSSLGFSALLRTPLKRVEEVVVDPVSDLVVLMIASDEASLDVWIDGRARGSRRFQRGDLICLPPGFSSRWCGLRGQPGAFHLHISRAQLRQFDLIGPAGTMKGLTPAVGFRDNALQKLMTRTARIDHEAATAPIEIAALGNAILLHLMERPPSQLDHL